VSDLDKWIKQKEIQSGELATVPPGEATPQRVLTPPTRPVARAYRPTPTAQPMLVIADPQTGTLERDVRGLPRQQFLHTASETARDSHHARVDGMVADARRIPELLTRMGGAPAGPALLALGQFIQRQIQPEREVQQPPRSVPVPREAPNAPANAEVHPARAFAQAVQNGNMTAEAAVNAMRGMGVLSLADLRTFERRLRQVEANRTQRR
jgi:hypothetical protein